MDERHHRQVHLVPSDSRELSVPADVTELVGDGAQLGVGPGHVVGLRPAKLRSAALAAGVAPLDDPARLRHTTSPLTSDERAALARFLTE